MSVPRYRYHDPEVEKHGRRVGRLSWIGHGRAVTVYCSISLLLVGRTGPLLVLLVPIPKVPAQGNTGQEQIPK